MMKQDLLQRFIFDKASVRGEFIRLENSYQTIIEQHLYPKPIRQLLGEALSVAGLLSAIIKFNGRLTVQFRGKGKLKMLLAQCDNQNNLRGLAKWEDSLSTYNDLMESFNDGILAIMIDGGLKHRYQGVVAWRGNSLTESIEGYFRESEQLATKIWLAVNDKVAAGFLLQVVPGGGGSSEIEKETIALEWERITAITSQLEAEALLNANGELLLRKLYPDDEIRLFPAIPVAFKCTCSRKRSEDAILLLGRHEVEEELKDKNSIVVTCDFCNEEYVFDRADVEGIFAAKAKPSSDTHLH